MSDEHAHAHLEYEPEGDFAFTNGKMGMWLFLVSDAMAFIGFLGAYMVLRLSAEMDPGQVGWNPAWGPKLDVVLTGINTFVLILSSVTMVKAFQAIQMGKKKLFRRFLLGTILGGTFFVSFQVFEWKHFITDIEGGGLGITFQGLELPDLDTALERAREKGLDIKRLGMAERLYGKRDTAGLDVLSHFSDEEYLAQDLLLASDAEEESRPEKAGIIQLPNFGVPAQGHTSYKNGKWISKTTREGKTSQDLRDLDYKELKESHARMSSNFASTFFLLTGFHGFHVFLGVLYMIVLFIMGGRGAFDENHNSQVEIAGLYWHFVDLVWVLLFMLIYLI